LSPAPKKIIFLDPRALLVARVADDPHHAPSRSAASSVEVEDLRYHSTPSLLCPAAARPNPSGASRGKAPGTTPAPKAAQRAFFSAPRASPAVTCSWPGGGGPEGGGVVRIGGVAEAVSTAAGGRGRRPLAVGRRSERFGAGERWRSAAAPARSAAIAPATAGDSRELPSERPPWGPRAPGRSGAGSFPAAGGRGRDRGRGGARAAPPAPARSATGTRARSARPSSSRCERCSGPGQGGASGLPAAVRLRRRLAARAAA